MSPDEGQVKNWWNTLKPQQRIEVFRLIPLSYPEQISIFSSRSWHQLHGWMREDLRKLYNMPGLLEGCGPLVYFRAQARLGCGQTVHGVTYFVISDADRISLPELGDSYAIALEELPTTNGKAHYWLISSERDYDSEVLLALSSVALHSGETARQ